MIRNTIIDNYYLQIWNSSGLITKDFIEDSTWKSSVAGICLKTYSFFSINGVLNDI
jgi:hypothetical protein